MRLIALLSLGLVAGRVGAQDLVVPLADAKSIAITVNTGTVTLRSHARRDVIIRGVRIDGRADLAQIDTKREGPVLQFAERRAGVPALSTVEFFLPAGVPVRFAGRPTRMTAQGLAVPLDVLMQHGMTEIADHVGTLSVNASAGKITVRNASGTTRLVGTSEDILVDSLVGTLSVETVAGSITLARVHGSTTDASTRSGSIVFDGGVQATGAYSFTSLNGDVTWRVPASADAAVAFGSAQGTVRLEGGFPTPGGVEGSMRTLVLGSGSAQVKLLTFKGNIVVIRR